LKSFSNEFLNRILQSPTTLSVSRGGERMGFEKN
jgi:hypothetical protein